MGDDSAFAAACGLDEAGRGPLAGPVFAACVCLPRDFPFELLGDSKKLARKARERAYAVIVERSRWGIGQASHEEIDRINILNATLLAMRRAWEAMVGSDSPVPAWQRAVVDGNRAPDLPVPCEAIVKGDGKIYEIMAASVLAKVARDAEMARFAALYPEYGYDRHSGYPTAEHRRVCRELGPSPIQRRTFRY
jgi:ribonuclease HII